MILINYVLINMISDEICIIINIDIFDISVIRTFLVFYKIDFTLLFL